MSDENITYGLMVCRVTRYGRDYLEARVLIRNGDSDFPLNPPSWYAYQQKPYVDDLVMIGSVYALSDEYGTFSLDGPEFNECRGVGVAQASGMVKILTAIGKQMKKDDAQEPGDKFLAFARGIGAKWVVFPRRGRMETSSYEDNRWAWYGLSDGRNRYRQMIAEMLTEERQRLAEIKKAKQPAMALTDNSQAA